MSDTRGPGYCVTCPRCGKVHQKSYATDSIILCTRCGYEYYVYLKNGVTVEMAASQLENKQFLERLKVFAKALDEL